MDEKEDIKREAAKCLRRLQKHGRTPGDIVSGYFSGTSPHSYLKSVASGRFSQVNPKRIRR